MITMLRSLTISSHSLGPPCTISFPLQVHIVHPRSASGFLFMNMVMENCSSWNYMPRSVSKMKEHDHGHQDRPRRLRKSTSIISTEKHEIKYMKGMVIWLSLFSITINMLSRVLLYIWECSASPPSLTCLLLDSTFLHRGSDLPSPSWKLLFPPALFSIPKYFHLSENKKFL
jgi:hypothetical protein